MCALASTVILHHRSNLFLSISHVPDDDIGDRVRWHRGTEQRLLSTALDVEVRRQMLLIGSMEQNLQRNLHWGALFQQAVESTFGWSENLKKKPKNFSTLLDLRKVFLWSSSLNWLESKEAVSYSLLFFFFFLKLQPFGLFLCYTWKMEDLRTGELHTATQC